MLHEVMWITKRVPVLPMPAEQWTMIEPGFIVLSDTMVHCLMLTSLRNPSKAAQSYGAPPLAQSLKWNWKMWRPSSLELLLWTSSCLRELIVTITFVTCKLPYTFLSSFSGQYLAHLFCGVRMKCSELILMLWMIVLCSCNSQATQEISKRDCTLHHVNSVHCTQPPDNVALHWLVSCLYYLPL